MCRLLLVLLLPVLAACGSTATPGGQEGADPSPTATSAPLPTPEPAEPTGLAAGDDGTWTPWSKGGPAAIDLRDLRDLSDLDQPPSPGFATVDGGVRCLFDPFEPGHGNATVLCVRDEGLGVDQPRPADCEGDWGDAVWASVLGGGVLVCQRPGDPDLDPDRTLPDGASVTYDGLTCAVRRGDVQCLTPDGRGLVIGPGAIVTR